MNKSKNYVFTSESVTEGHPDKVCDQVSDAVLDEILKTDPNARVACETFVTVGMMIIGGEITTNASFDPQTISRNIIKNIGYDDPKYGFNYKTCGILNAIGKQSPDISQGVDIGGAGDQGIMIGFATDETEELMPMPIVLAHKLTKRLAKVRKEKILPYLGPDGKSQVSIEYANGKPKRIDSIVLSSQHTEDILDETGKKIKNQYIDEIIQKVIFDEIDNNMLDKNTKIYVNPTGKFVIGGPQSDTGMTGRKIIVDTYGGMAAHGGGAFSGKDPSKVDRSASYAARFLAKQIVASKIAKKCTIELSYAIGVREPISIMVDTMGSSNVPSEIIEKAIRENFDLTPGGIIKMLDLKKPIYLNTASYGHFGRENFTWEKTDKKNIFENLQ